MKAKHCRKDITKAASLLACYDIALGCHVSCGLQPLSKPEGSD